MGAISPGSGPVGGGGGPGDAAPGCGALGDAALGGGGLGEPDLPAPGACGAGLTGRTVAEINKTYINYEVKTLTIYHNTDHNNRVLS